MINPGPLFQKLTIFIFYNKTKIEKGEGGFRGEKGIDGLQGQSGNPGQKGNNVWQLIK